MLLKRASAAQAASSSHRSACPPPSAAVPAPACRASRPAAAAAAQCAWPAQAVAGPRHAANQREQGVRSRVVAAATAGAAAEELEVRVRRLSAAFCCANLLPASATILRPGCCLFPAPLAVKQPAAAHPSG